MKNNDQQLIDEGYKKGVKSFEYQWNEIEKHFDWNKVYQTMKALDWGWSKNGALYVPMVGAIKLAAKDICKRAYEGNISMTGSGGLNAGMENGCLWLNFIVTDWMCE